MLRAILALSCMTALAGRLEANPYPDEAAVPKVAASFLAAPALVPGRLDAGAIRRDARDVLRVRLDWDQARDTFQLASAVVEPSGTDALIARSAREDALGSYKAALVDPLTGEAFAHDSIGTGQEYRRLTRALSFRLPVPAAPADLRVVGENPATGVMEELLVARIDPAVLPRLTPAAVEVRVLRPAQVRPALILNVYAEGYPASAAARFFQEAARVGRALEQDAFPAQERLEIRGVFAPSATALGTARNLGTPIPERNSFLGLYFPYWRSFGRWYHVVYPTREERLRAALATAPHDYALALVDDSQYWGVGNFRQLTAVPARSSSFAYLLAHELGHFFGLNEEYESGGATELAFAPGIEEPWSQNITFLRDTAALKWGGFVPAGTPLPTPASRWRTSGPLGAYAGGYAQTEPLGESHKPGLSCTMNSHAAFCRVCRDAIERRVRFDLGE